MTEPKQIASLVERASAADLLAEVRSWWKRRGFKSEVVAAQLMKDGYVKIHWQDDDESDTYSVPLAALRARLKDQTL